MLKRAVATFGNIFGQFYGQTEAGTLSFLSPKEMVLEGPIEKVKRLGSCGREVINVEIRIVDEQGRDVPTNEVGEIIAKSDHMWKGYWKLPQATAEIQKCGYLYTGDLATMDDEGYIYLVGRKKDTIISGGKAVYPTEVEEVLYRHPAVSEAAVIGIPDKQLGESIKAFIVLKKKTTEGEIIEFCQRSLAAHAVPKSVEFVDTLPRSARGKVLRKVLREKYQ
jgi:acyl-CoA synthetase (AMP-forming)/AMP-acid ligase II